MLRKSGIDDDPRFIFGWYKTHFALIFSRAGGPASFVGEVS
jgi:hypothetical protein